MKFDRIETTGKNGKVLRSRMDRGCSISGGLMAWFADERSGGLIGDALISMLIPAQTRCQSGFFMRSLHELG